MCPALKTVYHIYLYVDINKTIRPYPIYMTVFAPSITLINVPFIIFQSRKAVHNIDVSRKTNPWRKAQLLFRYYSCFHIIRKVTFGETFFYFGIFINTLYDTLVKEKDMAWIRIRIQTKLFLSTLFQFKIIALFFF